MVSELLEILHSTSQKACQLINACQFPFMSNKRQKQYFPLLSILKHQIIACITHLQKSFPYLLLLVPNPTWSDGPWKLGTGHVTSPIDPKTWKKPKSDLEPVKLCEIVTVETVELLQFSLH